jgi:sugar phosphate isomerase/epimerase
MRKISVLASSFSISVRDIPRAARLAGFEGLEFDVASALVDLNQLSATGAREFRHMLAAENQQLAALRADIGSKGLSLGADVDAAIARLDQAMRTARQLAAPCVCVDLGPLPPSNQPPKPKPKVTQAMAGLIIIPSAKAESPVPEPVAPKLDPAFTDQVKRAMGVIGELADRYSVMLAFRSDLAGFAALSEAVRSADCPWFGIDFDPVAAKTDDWSFDEVFDSLGALIRHVRVRDALVSGDRRTKPVPVGQGSVDWPHVSALLDDAGYSGWLGIDATELAERATAARVAIKTLRALQ